MSYQFRICLAKWLSVISSSEHTCTLYILHTSILLYFLFNALLVISDINHVLDLMTFLGFTYRSCQDMQCSYVSIKLHTYIEKIKYVFLNYRTNMQLSEQVFLKFGCVRCNDIKLTSMSQKDTFCTSLQIILWALFEYNSLRLH